MRGTWRVAVRRAGRDQVAYVGMLVAVGAVYYAGARIGLTLHLFGKRDQPVGFAGHRRYHNHNLMPLVPPLGDPSGDVLDALGAADGGAAVFLNDQSHARNNK